MEKPKEETPAPRPGEPRLPEAPEVKEPPVDPGGEKTPEQKEIETLHAQKEHQREKREEAEEDARKAREDLDEYKKANQTSNPSDEELIRKDPEFEFKDEEDKERIRQEESREKRLRQLEEKEAWNTDYTKILKKYPQIAKNEEEFKEEAYKHPKSTSLETIARSFLFDKKEETPPETPPVPERPGLEPPTAGPTDPPPVGMTDEQAKKLREDDPKKYAELVKAGKIK